MKIRNLLKQSKSVLFCDSEHFNKEVKGIRHIEDLKDWMQIKGRVYKKQEYGNTVEYKLAGSGYTFSLSFVL